METRLKAAKKARLADLEARNNKEGWHLMPTELLSRIFESVELKER